MTTKLFSSVEARSVTPDVSQGGGVRRVVQGVSGSSHGPYAATQPRRTLQWRAKKRRTSPSLASSTGASASSACGAKKWPDVAAPAAEPAFPPWADAGRPLASCLRTCRVDGQRQRAGAMCRALKGSTALQSALQLYSSTALYTLYQHSTSSTPSLPYPRTTSSPKEHKASPSQP